MVFGPMIETLIVVALSLVLLDVAVASGGILRPIAIVLLMLLALGPAGSRHACDVGLTASASSA